MPIISGVTDFWKDEFMGFFDKKGGNRRPVFQKPPQSRGPKTPEKPLLLPPLDEGKRPIIRDPTVSGEADTVAASDQISFPPSLRNPTRNINGGRPPPPKARPPPLPETVSDEISEIKSAVIKSAVISYQSKIQEFDAVKAPDEKLLDQLRKLHNQASQFLEAKRNEPGQRDEDLQRLNGVVEQLSDRVIQMMAKVQFQVNKDEAEKQAARPPPIPAHAPQPPVPFGESIDISLSTTVPPQMAQPNQVETPQQPGAFKRFITSPVTWAAINLSAFTALMFSKHAFKEMAEFVGMALKKNPPSERLTMIVYGAVSAGFLTVTILVNYLRNRSAEKKEKMQDQQHNGGPIQYS